jgi:hypothetical protein
MSNIDRPCRLIRRYFGAFEHPISLPYPVTERVWRSIFTPVAYPPGGPKLVPCRLLLLTPAGLAHSETKNVKM